MAKLLQLALVPAAASAVFTPQGERAADCIVQVPDTATVKTHDTGISLHHDDGRVEHITTPDHCHTDDVAVALAQRDSNQWIDEAGFTYNPGFSKMTGYNNIPDAPRSEEHTSEPSHTVISYAVFCLKKKTQKKNTKTQKKKKIE